MATTAAEAVHEADVICLCLLDDAAVREVLSQSLAACRPNAVLLDHSTISVAAARAMAVQAAAADLSYLDAPVSGGVAGAEAGSLTIRLRPWRVCVWDRRRG